MRYFVEIYTDNAAFEDSPGPEVARILRELADKVEGYAPDESDRNVKFGILDSNGNYCGKHGYT